MNLELAALLVRYGANLKENSKLFCSKTNKEGTISDLIKSNSGNNEIPQVIKEALREFLTNELEKTKSTSVETRGFINVKDSHQPNNSREHG